MNIEPGDTVRSPTFKGVALEFLGYAKRFVPYDNSAEAVETGYWEMNYDIARVRMIGDDKEHEVDFDKLKLLGDGAYCCGCGQIGCQAYERP